MFEEFDTRALNTVNCLGDLSGSQNGREVSIYNRRNTITPAQSLLLLPSSNLTKTNNWGSGEARREAKSEGRKSLSTFESTVPKSHRGSGRGHDLVGGGRRGTRRVGGLGSRTDLSLLSSMCPSSGTCHFRSSQDRSGSGRR